MALTARWGLALAILSVLAGCSSSSSFGPRGSCDPLDPSVCAFPFPSSFYLEQDATTDTGLRVSFAADSLPEFGTSGPVDPQYLNEKDGFSILSPMIFYFADVSLAGTISHDDIGAYTASDAKTVIINADTGERLAHWVELDGTEQTGEPQAVLLRPAVPMDFDTRYVVGIRGLTDSTGAAIAPSDAFRALRDGTSTQDQDVERQRRHFEQDIFPVLEAQGFQRSELQLAWDFHTKSRTSTIGQALTARDDALTRWDASGPPYTIASTQDFDCTMGGDNGIGRELIVDVTGPLYTETDAPGTLLTRGTDGMPEYNGTTTFDFMIRIPCSLIANPQAAPMIEYGHGLFGSYSEARTGWLSQFANTNGYVVFAADWKGMSSEDVTAIIGMLGSDPGRFGIVPERSVQGFINFMAAAAVMKGAMVNDPAVKFDNGMGTMVSVLDPTQLYFYGISQGGILGGAYTALSPDVTRATLGVGGMPYSLLLPRSLDFTTFYTLIRGLVSDQRDRMLFIAGLTQQLWDVGEGAGYAHDMNKPVLLQAALGDHQVTTLGAEIQARAFGANTIMPQTQAVWDVQEMTPPFTGSGFVEFEYSDVPAAPDGAMPPPDDGLDPHECPRREPAGQMQVDTFFKTGVIDNYCNGICDDNTKAAICP